MRGELASASFAVGLNAVVLAVTDEVPRVLTVTVDDELVPDGLPALPAGSIDPTSDRTLELALRHQVRDLTGLEVGYVEQLYTFGDRDRDPAVRQHGVRPISIGYLALVHEQQVASGAAWRPVYELLPWEDHRQGPPSDLAEVIVPALGEWAAEACPDQSLAAQREERRHVALGLGTIGWDGVRALDRLELLYEAGLLDESTVLRRPPRRPRCATRLGQPMTLDHRRMLATAITRLRGKISYRPLVFELLPEHFTLLRLQRTVEALAGARLHKGNFRRLVDAGGLVVGTGEVDTGTGGRPAELFRFRREVVGERRTPGVGIR